jgi:phospholipase/carboxylesterase
MTHDILPAIEIQTGAQPDSAVIWMHGLGDTGHGWSEVVPALQLPRALSVRFVFPHAPQIPVTINQGMRMPAWYDFREGDLNTRADLAGVRRSHAQVEALIAREETRGVAATRIVLAGFSQGGAIALYAGLRHRQRLAGIVALSTYLIAPDSLVADASAANRDVPIFMAHGTQDPVVQFRWADASRTALVAAGYRVEWHTYAMPHSAVPEEIIAIGRFLAAVLESGGVASPPPGRS